MCKRLLLLLMCLFLGAGPVYAQDADVGLLTDKVLVAWQQQCKAVLKKDSKYWHNFVPPNGMKVGRGLYVDATEIANVHWLEYMHYLWTDSGREAYMRALPDTTLWWRENAKFLSDSTGLFLAENYLREPYYRFFPVVGITYEQALAYCEWRSKVVNMTLNKQFARKGYALSVYYRLPTPTEWEQAAAAMQDLSRYPFAYPALARQPLKKESAAEAFQSSADSLAKRSLLDFCPSLLIANTADRWLSCQFQQDVPLSFMGSVFSNPTNGFGLHNTVGNVAEMTDKKGIAKGGSWQHLLGACQIQRQQNYRNAHIWLGFRCVTMLSVSKIAKQKKNRRLITV